MGGAQGHAAGDLGHVDLLWLWGCAAVAVDGDGGWTVAWKTDAHTHAHAHAHHRRHDATASGHVAECETAASRPEWCCGSEGRDDAGCESAGWRRWEGHAACCVESETYSAVSTRDEVAYCTVSMLSSHHSLGVLVLPVRIGANGPPPPYMKGSMKGTGGSIPCPNPAPNGGMSPTGGAMPMGTGGL